MFQPIVMPQILRQHMSLLIALGAIVALLMLPDMAHAAEDVADQNLPFTDPLMRLKNAIKGPVAFALSLAGIIAAGGMLVFGGDMSGFLRTLIFLVLAISIVVNAVGMIEFLGGTAAVVASISSHAHELVGTSQGLG